MAKRRKLSDVLRTEIEGSGQSARKLGELSGVPQQRISAFLLGKDIRLNTADKLAAALGIVFMTRRPTVANCDCTEAEVKGE